MDDRAIDEKQIVRNAVCSYLGEHHPNQLREYEVTFDAVHASAEGLLTSAEETADAERDDDLTTTALGIAPQDLCDATIIGLSIFVALAIVKTTLRYVAKYHLLPNFDKWEGDLRKATGHPDLVHRVRLHVERELRTFVDHEPPDEKK